MTFQVYFEGRVVTQAFYFKAMDHFRSSGPCKVFVVATDDPKWAREKFSHLQDVIFAQDVVPKAFESKPDLFDFALLAHCNSSIFSYGTYGFFSAYLAGGEVVMASGYLTKNQDDLFEGVKTELPEWKLISE